MTELKKEYIIDALGELENRYVAEAAEYVKPKIAWKYWRELSTVAACLVTIVLTGTALRYLPIENVFLSGRSDSVADVNTNGAGMPPESAEAAGGTDFEKHMQETGVRTEAAMTETEQIAQKENDGINNTVEQIEEGNSTGIRWEVVLDAEESKVDFADKKTEQAQQSIGQSVGQSIGQSEEYKEGDTEPPAVMESHSISEWLSPEQILEQGRDIFLGTVTGKQIYRVTEGLNAYFTVLTVEIEDCIRGTLAQGEEYTIYLPVAAGEDLIQDNSLSGDLLKLEVGSRAIFMPLTATVERGIAGKDNAWLSYSDFANYFYEEGVRYLFLETETGVSYAKEVYEISDESTVTLEDVAEYMRNMISE